MANPLRKTIGSALGLADGEFDYEDAAPTAPQPVRPGGARVTQARSPPASAPPSPRSAAWLQKNASHSDEPTRSLTVHPRRYKDAQAIAEAFRDGIQG
jgi:cell division inhibitor SepF